MNLNAWTRYALHPAALAAAAAILTYIIMRLDCTACKEPRSTSVYCKNIAWVAALVGGAAYMLTNFVTTDVIDLSLEGLALEPDF